MNRRSNSTIGIVGVCCVTFLVLAAAQSFGAVINGFFESESLLSGWEYSDNMGVIWVSENLAADGTGSASLFESDDASPSWLRQTFLVDNGSETLTFNLRTPEWGTSETDYLYINLLDDNGDSLFNLENGFFQWSSDDGVFDGSDDVTIVETIDETAGFAFYAVTVPVSLWVEDNVTLRFQLIHEIDDDFETMVLVDNVVLHGTPPVVPIPGAMGLALSGLAAMGVFARKLA